MEATQQLVKWTIDPMHSEILFKVKQAEALLLKKAR